MRTLVALPISPWSEMARWSLDHHRLDYRYETYMPMIGEPLLRLRTQNLLGPMTVPVLFEGGAIYRETLEIARHAGTLGRGTALFPSDRHEDILKWKVLSDRLLRVGRGIVLAKMAASRDAQMEAIPRAIPRPLRRAMAPMARLATRYLAAKYRAPTTATTSAPEVVDTLDALRRALGGRDTLFDAFSYADIAMACALQFVIPVKSAHMRLPPATRAAWTCADLAEKYGDLMTWRDRLYAAFRDPSPEN